MKDLWGGNLRDPVMKDKDLGLDELCYIVKNTKDGKVKIPIEIKHFTHKHALHLTTKDKEIIKSTTMMKDEDLGLDELCYIVKKTKVGEDKVEIPIEIKHFTHKHDLHLTTKLENDKICDGCIRSIFPPFYSCAQCNFFLHKSCAELPVKSNTTSPTLPHPTTKEC
jgi:hypothetical protein